MLTKTRELRTCPVQNTLRVSSVLEFFYYYLFYFNVFYLMSLFHIFFLFYQYIFLFIIYLFYFLVELEVMNQLGHIASLTREKCNCFVYSGGRNIYINKTKFSQNNADSLSRNVDKRHKLIKQAMFCLSFSQFPRTPRVLAIWRTMFCL